MKSYILPRLQDVIFFCIFVAALMLGPRMLNQDGDLSRHLSMGRYVLQTLSIPTRDVFSYTNTDKPFAPHEWLAGVVFYIVYTAFGLNGIVWLAALVLATSFMLLYRQGVLESNLRLPIFVLVVWGAAASSLHWITRPHLFSMLFLTVWLILTRKLARGEGSRLWLFPLLMIFWANMHGEFIAGFLVLFALLAGWVWDSLTGQEDARPEVGKRLVLVTLTSGAATLLNPVGARAWTTVLGYLNNHYLVSHTNETIPPSFLETKFLVLLALLGFSIFLLAVKERRLSAGQSLLLAGFSAMSLLSARNVHLYGVVAPFVLASALAVDNVQGSRFTPWMRMESLLQKIEGGLRGLVWPVCTALLCAFLLASTALGQANRFDPGFFPVQAVDWLKQNPQEGQGFNAFNWGGYLIFNLWPEKRVFIDSQTDVYGEAFTREYEKVIVLAPGWQEVLERYQAQWALIPSSWPLGEALVREGWKEVYRDGTSVVLVK